jgi:dTDP-4-dehydrorhamnose reductase
MSNLGEGNGGGVTSPSILVLGGTGMLGHKLFQCFLPRFPRTFCTIHQDARHSPYSRIALFQGPQAVDGIDVFDFDKLSKLLFRLKPDFIINCVGVIKQRDEASSYISTITVNALLPHKLAELCSRWGGRLIHFSTDCVFSGRRGVYKEDDPSDAEDLYGKTKFLGETTEANALTLRTSIIGRELQHHRSLLDWFLSNKGGKVKGYSKSIYSGVTTNHLAEVVSEIIVKFPLLNGVFQVASEPISKYELLGLLRDAYAVDVEIVQVDGEDVDRSMDGLKFRAMTGYVCPPWIVLAKQLAEDPTPYGRWLEAES